MNNAMVESIHLALFDKEVMKVVDLSKWARWMLWAAIANSSDSIIIELVLVGLLAYYLKLMNLSTTSVLQHTFQYLARRLVQW